MKDIIKLLQKRMTREEIAAVVLFTGDPHGSEYLSDRYKSVEYFTGFSGDNARVLVTPEEAWLWTDGRYFIQAQEQLAGTGIELMRMGEKGVKTLPEQARAVLSDGERIGIEVKSAPEEIIRLLGKDNGFLLADVGAMIDEVWVDRPPVETHPVALVDDIRGGGSVSEKLTLLREKTEGKGVYLKSLDNIMYLFNLRGRDIPFNPLAYSYARVDEKSARLFLYPAAVTREVKEEMGRAGVEICDYADFDVGDYESADGVVRDMKAAKTPGQLQEIRKVFEQDSKAVIGFLYEMDRIYKSTEGSVSETAAAEILLEKRRSLPGFLYESFPAISAYGANAAMAHYETGASGEVEVERRGLYLCDSGGIYPGATTDVTRTIAVGEITKEERIAFTLVAAGWAELMSAVFKEGCTGRNLDILARQRLWSFGLDYNHGTGHGVGAGLCVHEGPQAIRWQKSERLPDCELKPGMLITDEPGYYKEGAFGIRTENTLLVIRDEHDGFLRFEPLTLVPIDRTCLDLTLLSDRERALIDSYHALVLERMGGSFDGDELRWLKEQCREL